MLFSNFRTHSLGLLLCLMMVTAPIQGMNSLAPQIQTNLSASQSATKSTVHNGFSLKKALSQKRAIHKFKKKLKKASPEDLPSQRLAATGFGLSLGSLFVLFALPGLAILLSIAGLIVSIIALNKIKANPDLYRGKTLAIVGIFLGLFTLFLFTTILIDIIRLVNLLQ
ncbi:MAG: DUF4190 domain-containing protein [Saprospiraceae bacterium]